MGTRKKLPRKRCSECRRWFEPSRSAERSQKTCSQGCREERRRKQAKRRRNRDIEGYRADERQRKAASRQRMRAQGAAAGVKGRQRSRATLSPQEAILRDEIVHSWDEMLALSRAGLERRIAYLLGRSGENQGQSGTRNGESHAPP